MTKPGTQQAALPTGEFEDFFVAEYPRLTRALFLLCGSSPDAEEMAQEAMVRIYERWPSVRGMRSPSGYLYVTAMNLRRRRFLRLRRFTSLQPKEERSTRSTDGEIDGVEVRSDLIRALGQLSREQREALILIAWLDMSTEEVAELLGIEPSSVRGRIHRARQALHTILGGER